MQLPLTSIPSVPVFTIHKSLKERTGDTSKLMPTNSSGVNTQVNNRVYTQVNNRVYSTRQRVLMMLMVMPQGERTNEINFRNLFTLSFSCRLTPTEQNQPPPPHNMTHSKRSNYPCTSYNHRPLSTVLKHMTPTHGLENS